MFGKVLDWKFAPSWDRCAGAHECGVLVSCATRHKHPIGGTLFLMLFARHALYVLVYGWWPYSQIFTRPTRPPPKQWDVGAQHFHTLTSTRAWGAWKPSFQALGAELERFWIRRWHFKAHVDLEGCQALTFLWQPRMEPCRQRGSRRSRGLVFGRNLMHR